MLLFSAQRSDEFCGRLAIVLAEVAIGGGFGAEADAVEEGTLVLQWVASQLVGDIVDAQAIDIVEEGGVGILAETA